jgi:hypothetical protein
LVAKIFQSLRLSEDNAIGSAAKSFGIPFNEIRVEKPEPVIIDVSS